jgi:hypothetical protein
MENATFCCLFHEITLSTKRDIKDFVSQSHGAKFQRVQYANLFLTSLQVNDKIHFEPSKYLWSLFSI